MIGSFLPYVQWRLKSFSDDKGGSAPKAISVETPFTDEGLYG